MNIIKEFLTKPVGAFYPGGQFELWHIALFCFLPVLPLMLFIFFTEKKNDGAKFGIFGYYLFKLFGRKKNGN